MSAPHRAYVQVVAAADGKTVAYFASCMTCGGLALPNRDTHQAAQMDAAIHEHAMATEVGNRFPEKDS